MEGDAIMTESQKDNIIRCWNCCNGQTKIRIAAEFFSIMRSDKSQRDWWRFLNKRLLTST